MRGVGGREGVRGRVCVWGVEAVVGVVRGVRVKKDGVKGMVEVRVDLGLGLGASGRRSRSLVCASVQSLFSSMFCALSSSIVEWAYWSSVRRASRSRVRRCSSCWIC